jgi:hypothetical protein
MQRQQNIETLVELGIELSHRIETYYEYLGSNVLWGDSLQFYVHDDYVVGEHIFKQRWDDLRIINDDLIIAYLDQGLPLPNIEPNAEIGERWYIITLKGNDAKEIYEKISEYRDIAHALRIEKGYSGDVIKKNQEISTKRFMAPFGTKVLRPVPGLEEDSDEIYEEREKDDRADYKNAMERLMRAYNAKKTRLFGELIEGIKTAAIPLNVDPQKSIYNIMSGRFMYVVK